MSLVQPATALQDAYEQAKAAFAAGEVDRAISLTQYLLRYYPHYLDAYQLLGQAYLEQGRAEDAGRFFSHVLSGDPQNVLAHVGRAVIAEERGQVDDAIDAYERAFEIDPSIAEVRTELLRLYKSRYGSAGAALRTTPTGLAYGHLRGGLRDSAISELGYVAQTRPDRWDIKVALAEALWRNERPDEAAAVATEILASHSSCVKCHWILGYINWAAGRTETGRQYLVDAVALDPTYRVAEAIWAATPWQFDKAITVTQVALVPAWSAHQAPSAEPEAVPSPPSLDDPTARPRRVTAPLNGHGGSASAFGPPHVTEPLAPLPEQVDKSDLPPAPLPLDLDWFDEWIAATEPPTPAENKQMVAEVGYNLGSEEDKMAPSYGEDDDQGRQFDFDWDRDALPDYLRPFLADQSGQAAPSHPAQPAHQAEVQPLPTAPSLGDTSWRDYGTPAAAGDFEFDEGALPPWMAAESIRTASFISVDGSPGGGPFAADLSAEPPDEFDFSGIQPFDFAVSSAATGRQATAADYSPAVTYAPNGFNDDVDDFIDFLSATSAEEAQASQKSPPAGPLAPATLPEFDFGFGTDMQTFSSDVMEPVHRAKPVAPAVVPPPASTGPGNPPISFGVQQEAQTAPASTLRELSETASSIFTKARRRKQKMEQTLRQDAKSSGQANKATETTTPEEEARQIPHGTHQEGEGSEPASATAQESAHEAGATVSAISEATEASPTSPPAIPSDAPAAPPTPIETSQAVLEDPPPPPTNTQQAMAAEASSPPSSDGLEELGRHIQANPTDVAARLALAIGYEQRDDVVHAGEHYRELIRSHATPAHLLEIVTGNLSDLLTSRPEDPTLHRLLGDAYMKQGLFQPAISEYNWLLTNGGR